MQPYIGEIRMFAGNFPPDGWEFCSGQTISIAENDTLYQLIGTTFGGDGQTTFVLPDLRGRVPIHSGSGTGLSPRTIGENGGTESVTVTNTQMPVHSHPLLASNDPANSSDPGAHVPATPAAATPFYDGTPIAQFASTVVTPVGGNQPHDNLQPYGCVNYIISMFGVYPTQS